MRFSIFSYNPGVQLTSPGVREISRPYLVNIYAEGGYDILRRKETPYDRHYVYSETVRHVPARTLFLANPATQRRSWHDADEIPIKIPGNPPGCEPMKLTETIHEFGFYARATEHGLALVLMLGILTIRSLITNKPVLS
jgi:hypothetical protein